MAFENVGENLTQKMGPFPVWVWGVLIGGAFVVWYWVAQRDLGSGELPTEDTGTDTVATPSGDFATVPVMPPSDGVQDEATNLEWSVQALNAVTGTGTSLIAAQAAISKYLNGDKLTNAEAGIINKVLQKIGPPPEGVSTPDLPTPTPEKPTTTNDTSTVVSGATTRRFGQSTVIYIQTKWSQQSGHTGNPGGSVTVYIDDARRATLPLINGRAIYVITPFKGMGSTKDKRWVVRATYVPSKTSGAKSSVSNLHLITLS